MKIKYSRKFKKQYARASKKIKRSFTERLKLFLKNSNHPLLWNHPLKGKLKKYRSINITGDWRAIYSPYKKGVVIFEMLGTHSQLYK